MAASFLEGEGRTTCRRSRKETDANNNNLHIQIPASSYFKDRKRDTLRSTWFSSCLSLPAGLDYFPAVLVSFLWFSNIGVGCV